MYWFLILCSFFLPCFWTSIQFSHNWTELCPTLCNPMDCSSPGFPVQHQLLKLAQTHVYWFGDTIPPHHPVIPFSSCLLDLICLFFMFFSWKLILFILHPSSSLRRHLKLCFFFFFCKPALPASQHFHRLCLLLGSKYFIYPHEFFFGWWVILKFIASFLNKTL